MSESPGEGLDLSSDAAVVVALRARSAANESLVYAHHVFAEVNALASRYQGGRESILEIGSGANLATLFCFAGSGYERVAGVDIAPPSAPGIEFYRVLRDYLSCVGGWRWWRHFSTASYPNVIFPDTADHLDVLATLERIDYRAPVSSAALPFSDGSFDVVFSVASLEHSGGSASRLVTHGT